MTSDATFASVSPSVLIVDDHAESLTALARLLRLSGYQVHGAGSVGEARAVAAANPCDLLISDIGLPDGSGLELMRDLRAQSHLDGRTLRGIALTGFTDATDVLACQQAGFGAFLPKPVAFDDVLTALHQLRGETAPAHAASAGTA